MIQVFSFTHQSFTKLPFWGSWGQMGKEGRTHGTLNKSSVFSLCLLTQTSCHAAIACSRGLGRASERKGREAKVWSTPGDAPPLQTWAIRLAQWGLPCLQIFPSLFSFMAILKVIGFKIYWVLLHTLHIRLMEKLLGQNHSPSLNHSPGLCHGDLEHNSDVQVL